MGFCREVVEGGVESGQEAHLVVHPDHAVVQYLRNYSIVLVSARIADHRILNFHEIRFLLSVRPLKLNFEKITNVSGI